MTMPATRQPRLLVLAPETLFGSFFDAALQRRMSRRFGWRRVPGRRISAAMRLALREADALITTWDSPAFGDELLRLAPRLRVIGHCGGEVKSRFAKPLFERLTIVNAPGPMAGFVAELAVTFLLHAARNLDGHREALRRRSNAVYGRIHREGAGDETILGRPVGLLGFGRIGRSIAELLRPFGVRLRVHDPFVAPERIRRYGAQACGFEAVLATRFLIVAAALTPATRQVLDRRALARMPDGATLVNVARGGLVDLAALTREVAKGRLRCAIDVTDPAEPLPLRHPLRRLRGALVTPHVGAAQSEVRRQMAASVVEDLERVLRGARARNRVSPAMLERMT
jgi:phosphoglycerate dehydrogenase-like enzyme